MGRLSDGPQKQVRMQYTIPTLFAALEAGDGSAAEALFAALYSELHRVARRELARRGLSSGAGGGYGASAVIRDPHRPPRRWAFPAIGRSQSFSSGLRKS